MVAVPNQEAVERIATAQTLDCMAVVDTDIHRTWDVAAKAVGLIACMVADAEEDIGVAVAESIGVGLGHPTEEEMVDIVVLMAVDMQRKDRDNRVVILVLVVGMPG